MKRRQFLKAGGGFVLCGIAPKNLLAAYMSEDEHLDSILLAGLKAVATPCPLPLGRCHDFSVFRKLRNVMIAASEHKLDGILFKTMPDYHLSTLSDLADVVLFASYAQPEQAQNLNMVLNYLNDQKELLQPQEINEYLSGESNSCYIAERLKKMMHSPEVKSLLNKRSTIIEQAVNVIEVEAFIDFAEYGYYPYENNEEAMIKDLLASLQFFINEAAEFSEDITESLDLAKYPNNFAQEILAAFSDRPGKILNRITGRKQRIFAEYYHALLPVKNLHKDWWWDNPGYRETIDENISDFVRAKNNLVNTGLPLDFQMEEFVLSCFPETDKFQPARNILC